MSYDIQLTVKHFMSEHVALNPSIYEHQKTSTYKLLKKIYEFRMKHNITFDHNEFIKEFERNVTFSTVEGNKMYNCTLYRLRYPKLKKTNSIKRILDELRSKVI